MNKLLKVGFSVFFVSLALAIHKDKAAPMREIKVIPENIPVRENRSSLKENLQIAVPISKNPGPLKRPVGSSKNYNCPAENFYIIQNHYKKNQFKVCVEMKATSILTDGENRKFRVEIERLSDPFLGELAVHRFRVLFAKLDYQNEGRETILWDSEISSDSMNIYFHSLSGILSPALEDEFRDTWSLGSDVDSFCASPESREYSRVRAVSNPDQRVKFLARAELIDSDGLRIKVQCVAQHKCTCEPLRIPLKKTI